MHYLKPSTFKLSLELLHEQLNADAMRHCQSFFDCSSCDMFLNDFGEAARMNFGLSEGRFTMRT